ncbi:MAG: MaoC family dehydratase N-terminal domain-containing protein [Candidatus Nanopelagicales bacterium]
MAINTDFIGRTVGSSQPYQVGREKIREFATAIGDSNPAYHDVEAARALGHPDLVAPPTFAFAVTFKAFPSVLANPELGLDYSRVVHGSQSFDYSRPIYAGDELVTEAIVEDIRIAGKNELLIAALNVSTTDGEPVVHTTSTIVSRGTAPQSDSDEGEGE